MSMSLDAHLHGTASALRSLAGQLSIIETWGWLVADWLDGGGRLLAAGNGGSAAEAQHLTAELVGRYQDERRPLSAIALHADTSSLTAIGNDYGPDEAYARQVAAHGRPGDVLVALSTSGHSRNVVAAAERARAGGLRVLALTGPRPNPLADVSDACLSIQSAVAAHIQEAHLVAVHLLCTSVDERLGYLAMAGDRVAT